MTQISFTVPNWALWALTIYLIVSSVLTVTNIYLTKKKIDLEKWKRS